MDQQGISVTIVMAAYNGAEFVREQIESIQSQTHSNWTLSVRDDLSSDTTLRILEEMAQDDSRIRIVRDDKGNLRQCQNFNELLSIVKADKYVMCCDQDDVWFERKIEITLREMLKAESACPSGTPLLVFTGFRVADRNLHPLADLHFQNVRNLEKFDLRSLLGYGYVYGCTVMLNHRLLEESLPISAYAENHDYWIALTAAVLGKIVFVDEETMIHRKHAFAVTGGPHHNGLRARTKRHLLSRTSHERQLVKLDLQMISFNQFLRSKGNATSLMDAYVDALQSGGLNRLLKMIKLRIRKEGTPQQVIYYIDMLIVGRRGALQSGSSDLAGQGAAHG